MAGKRPINGRYDQEGQFTGRLDLAWFVQCPLGCVAIDSFAPNVSPREWFKRAGSLIYSGVVPTDDVFPDQQGP